MSRISENIRKITRAWGGKTTGNGISDALFDLYNNLPFGEEVKLTVFAPEQTVTTTKRRENVTLPASINLGKLYVITINGKTYECEPFLQSAPEIGDFITISEYEDIFSIINNEINFNVADTYTFSIYEKEETITRLPAKFMPEPIVFTTADMQTATCNKSYEECLELYQNKVFNAVVDVGIGIYPMTSYMYINDESGEDLCYTLTTSGSQIVIEYSKTGEITIQAVNNG